MKLVILISITLSYLGSFAQYKADNYFEANAAFAKNKFDVNLNWHHLHGISKNKKLKFGYGLRFTSFYASNQFYTTAPAELAKGKIGPAVLFTKKIPENIDSLSIASAQHNFLNVFILLQYTFFDKLDIGFNIDVIGFGFGGNKNATYINQNFGQNTASNVSVSNFNLLLIDVNDRGSLNSELFVRYWITKKWAAKLAVNHVFTEVTSSLPVQTLPQSNDRFRLVSDFISVGVTFKPWE